MRKLILKIDTIRDTEFVNSANAKVEAMEILGENGTEISLKHLHGMELVVKKDF